MEVNPVPAFRPVFSLYSEEKALRSGPQCDLSGRGPIGTVQGGCHGCSRGDLGEGLVPLIGRVQAEGAATHKADRKNTAKQRLVGHIWPPFRSELVFALRAHKC